MKIGTENKEKARAWKQAQKARRQVSVPGIPSGSSGEPPAKSTTKRYLAMFALCGYCVLAVAYWFYGLAYERGLVGYH